MLGSSGDLGGEGVQHALVLGRQGAAGEGERDALSEIAADVGLVRAGRRFGTGAFEHGPSIAAVVQQRGGAEPERRPELPEHVGDRSRPCQRAGEGRQRFGLGLQA